MSEQTVVHVSSELLPWSKTGGLGDVARALPAAQARLGVTAHVIAPYYQPMREGAPQVVRADKPIIVEMGGRSLRADVLKGAPAPGVTAWLLDAPDLYARDGYYEKDGVDHHDNAIRFAFLARAALEVVRRYNLKPDVIQAHDWQAGLVPLLVRQEWGRVFDTVMTIHNLGYQGIFPPEVMAEIGLDPSLFTPQGVEFWGRVNFLKAGLVFADRIVTVSPTYAEEIKTSELGYGLEGVLQERSRDLLGILNGIDVEEWNPARDPHIATPYTREFLEGKRHCKAALMKAAGFDAEDLARPVIGIVSRFVTQKGFDILFEAIDALLAEDAILVALGTGEPEHEARFRELADAYPEQVAVRLTYDNKLAHFIEAGADLFLMPSRYEPCGLNQMYSLRYGTIPIVRATGGLQDSVVDADHERQGYGFKFGPYTANALVDAVRRALAAYRDPERFATLQQRAMSLDLSWGAAAQKYLALYEELVEYR